MRHLKLLLALLIGANLSAHALPTFSLKTVVIDAGHGGKDPGAIGLNKTQEKDVALAVALNLGKKIKETYPEVKVLYTRITDVFIPLVDRANFANKNKADLFISIHCNSAVNRTAKGSSTYVLGLHKTQDNLDVAKRENAVIELEENVEKNYDFNPNSPEGHIIMSMKQNAFLEQSIDIAARIENELTGRKGNNDSRGVKQAGFFVLYQTSMPSLLAEIGFISNPTEEMYLASKEGQDEIAEGIFNAFSSYKAHIEKSGKAAVAAKEASSNGVAQANVPPKVVSNTEEVKPKAPATKEETKPAQTREVSATKAAEAKPEPVKAEPPKQQQPPQEVARKEEPKPEPPKLQPTLKEEAKPEPAKIEPPKIEEPKPAVSVAKKEEPKTPESAPIATQSKSGLVFKVQMFASSKALKWYPQLPEIFGKIDVETLPNGVNRFMTGNFSSYEEAEKLLPKAVSNGYADAFVIAYKDGERLDIAATRALKKK